MSRSPFLSHIDWTDVALERLADNNYEDIVVTSDGAKRIEVVKKWHEEYIDDWAAVQLRGAKKAKIQWVLFSARHSHDLGTNGILVPLHIGVVTTTKKMTILQSCSEIRKEGLLKIGTGVGMGEIS